MTAAVETPAAPETPTWEMPKVRLGQTVLYYRHGVRDGKIPHVGYVLKINRTTLTIRTVDAGIYSAVRHLDDPRLVESPEQRADLGAWDYTDEHRAQEAWVESVNQRLATIERQIAGLVTGKKGAEQKG